MRKSHVMINLEDIGESGSKYFIPITLRANALDDVELNFIENTIKAQNLQNQMNMHIRGLKYKMNNFVGL